jgi:hypothetical protein
MSEFFDVGQFKDKKGGGKRFTKLGYAKPRDGGGFWITLDALPIGDQIVVVPQREKTEGGAATKRPSDLDDEIGF